MHKPLRLFCISSGFTSAHAFDCQTHLWRQTLYFLLDHIIVKSDYDLCTSPKKLHTGAPSCNQCRTMTPAFQYFPRIAGDLVDDAICSFFDCGTQFKSLWISASAAYKKKVRDGGGYMSCSRCTREMDHS